MMRMLRTLGALAAISAAALAQPAAADDGFVVLSATGDGVPLVPGDLISPGAEVRIGEGVSIVVVGAGGRLLQLTGPCRCKLPEAPNAGASVGQTRGLQIEENLWNAALPTLRDLSDEDGGATARGADRATTPAPVAEQPDLWYMAVDSSGDRCVRRGEAVLWRREADRAVTLDVRSQAARETGLNWPAGEATMRLPDEFVVDGAPLILQVGAEPRRLVIHVLPDTIAETEWGEILIWMAARSCRRQAQFLVDGLNDGTLFPDHERRPGLSEL